MQRYRPKERVFSAKCVNTQVSEIERLCRVLPWTYAQEERGHEANRSSRYQVVERFANGFRNLVNDQ